MKVLVLAALLTAACSAPAGFPSAPPMAAPVVVPAMQPALATSAVPPYDRDEFGDGWRTTNRWCDTRDTILVRDLTATTTAHGCNVLAGTLRDPYSGRVVVGSTKAMQIDHMLPLAQAWRLGAWRWTKQRREAYANDPFVLTTTIGKINQAKSDKGLDEWLPQHDPCGYARHVDAIGDRYGLVDPARDGEVARACR